MSFGVVENSVEEGRPIVFYEFVLNSTVWRYVAADESIPAGGHLWTPAAISDDGTKQTGEPIDDAKRIDAPFWIGPSQTFMSGAPSKNILVRVFHKHEQSPEMRVVYIGEITQINYPIPGRSVITCESLLASMRREGLRLAWQRACPYVVYDPLCKLIKSTWGVAFTVLAIDGYSISIEVASTPEAGHFSGGFMEWDHPIRGTEFLFVDSHAAPQFLPLPPGAPNAFLTAFLDPGDLFVGATGTIYPGCNFTPARCQFFGNYDNYGGVPDLPGKSPFDGDPVF
jgi:hypothetical protein